MSVRARRALFVALLVACMPLAGWAGTYDLWRAVFGDDVGTSLAVFWDLQVETYVNVLLIVLVLDLVYRLRPNGIGGWCTSPSRWPVRAATYAGLALLALICAAEGPLRSVLQVPLPDDIAASVAHYFRRALEGVVATIGLMAFMDAVRPARPCTPGSGPIARRSVPAGSG